MFEISEQLILEQSDEIFGVSQISCESSPWKQFSLVNDERSHQSLACKDLCFLRFCVMSWKDESEPNIKYFLGATVGMVQRIIPIQNFGHSRRRTDGIRVEKFPKIHHIAARRRSPQVHEQNGRPNAIPKTNYLSMTSYGEIKTMKRNVLLIPHLCLYSEKDFQQDVGHSSDLVRNKVVFHWQRKTRRKMGSSRWIDDDQIRRKRTPSFPSNESGVSRNAQKQRRWKIIYTFLCRWWDDWNCFSHCQSVSTEQSQNCVKNTVSVKQERGDPCWQHNLTHCSSQQTYW